MGTKKIRSDAASVRRHGALLSAVAIAASLAAGSSANATTYYYTPTGTAVDNWSSGTAAGWNALPVSASGNQLIFNSVIGTTSNNNIGANFLTNVLELDNFTNPSTPTAQTIGGSGISLVGGASLGIAGSQNPQILLNAIGTNATYNISAPLTTATGVLVGGGGTANFILNEAVASSGAFNVNDAASFSTTFVPGVLNTYGEGTLTLNTNTGAVIVGGTNSITSTETIDFAPLGLGANVALTAGGTYRLEGGNTFKLDAGQNSSVSVTFGTATATSIFGNNGSFGTAEIAAAQGLSSLGTTDKFDVLSSPGLLGTAIPTVTGVNILSPNMVVVDNDANQSADFGVYSAATAGTGGGTADAGVQAVSLHPSATANYLSQSTFTSAASTNASVVELTSNTTLTATTAAYALSVTGSTLSLGSNVLALGSPAFSAVSGTTLTYGGLILNGGTIGSVGDTGTLTVNQGSNPVTSLMVYTSLANGTINSAITTGNVYSIVKFGPGTLFLKNTTNFNKLNGNGSVLEINSGSVDVGTIATATAIDNTGALPAAALWLNGGVLEANGGFDRTLLVSTSSANAYSMAWGSRSNGASASGGFAAKGGNLTVNINYLNAPLVWGSAVGFVGDNNSLIFGSPAADSQVIFQNAIDLGATSQNYYREINTNSGTGSASLVLNGVISDESGGEHGLLKDGTGTVYLTAANTFLGKTMVTGGTLDLMNSLALQNSTLAGGAVTFDSSVSSHAFTLGGLTGPANLALADNAGLPNNIALTLGTNNTSNYYNGVLSGGGSVNKVGVGVETFAGASTYTGTTTLTAGTINIGGAEIAGTSGPLGTSAANNPGSIIFNGGYLQFSAANQNDYSGRFSTAASQQFNIDTNGQAVTFATALISSSGSLTKIGAGTLTLTGASTYSGPTNINAGTVAVDGTGSLATSAVNFNGNGTFASGNTGASSSITRTLPAVNFNSGDDTLTINRNAGQDQVVALSSQPTRTTGATANFVNAGGANSATNGFTIAGQTPNSIIDQGTFFGGSSYAYYDSGGFVRGINYGGDSGATTTGSTSTIASTSYAQATGAISAQATAAFTTLNIVNTGNTAQVFTLASGATVTTNGILRSGGSAGNAGLVNISGGTAITPGPGAELVIRTDTVNDPLYISTPIVANGTNALTKSGAGTLTLAGANTITGPVTIDSGTLDLANQLGLQNNTVVTSASSSLTFDSSITAKAFTLGGLSGNGNISLLNTAAAAVNLSVGNNNASTTFSGTLSGTGGILTKVGSGSLILTGVNTNTGATVISNGTLQLGDGTAGHDSTLTGNISDNSNLVIDPAGANYYETGIISGTGTLTKSGPGTLFLGAASTYTGVTTLNSGTVVLRANESAGASGPLGKSAAANPGSIVLNGAILQYAPAPTTPNDYSGRFSTANNQQYNIDTNTLNVTYATALASSGGELTKYGGGILILTGANSYTGTSTLNAGEVNLGSAESAGNSGPLGNSPASNPGSIILNGGYLQFSTANTNDYSGRFSTAPNQQYNIDTNGKNVTFATALTSSGAPLNKIGVGSLILTAAETYTGVTTVSAGALQLGNGTSGQDGSLASNSIVDGASVVFNLFGTVTYGGVISGAGSITKSGAGTLVLTGTDTYSGSTSISGAGSTLQLGDGTSGHDGAIPNTANIIDNANLVADVFGTNTINAPISGAAGTVTKIGAGTLTLTAASTYAGNTNISAGTLIVKNATGSATGGSPVTVGAAGTLAGTGIITGLTTVNGTIFAGLTNDTPGKTASTLTIGSGSILAGTTLLDLTAAPSSTPGTGASDEIVFGGAGAATLGGVSPVGTLDVTNPNSISFAAGQSYKLFGFTSESGTFNSVELPTLSSSLTWDTSALYTSGVITIDSSGGGPGTTAWNLTTGGSWIVAGNWTNGVPNSAGSVALFGNQTLSGPATITLDGSETVGRITFSDPSSYTIAAGSGGKLTIDDTGGSGGANPSVNVSTGTHSISANVTLANGVTVLGAGNLGISGNIDGSGGFTVAGPGVTTLSGINTYSGTTSVTGGTLNVNNLASLPSGGDLSVAGAANIAAVNGSGLQTLTLGNVTAGGTGVIKFSTSTLHTDRTIVAASSLSISGVTNSWTGALDLGGNDLVLAGGNIGTITNQLKQGYSNGSWTGGGIESLAAHSDTSHLTAIGVMQESGTGTFDGVGVTSSSIVLKYTYYGDANLDGVVNSSDYTRIDNAYLQGNVSGWQNGDFNYDGVINGSDYTLIDNAFNTQGAQLNAEIATPTAQIGSGPSSAVPEPASLGLLATAAIGMLGRRRRRM